MVHEHPEPDILCVSCGSRQVLELIADKWTVIIVYILALGPVRYNQLHRQIGGISQKMLTQTLRRLEHNGLVERTVYPVVPPRVDYFLTPLGETLIDALKAIGTWSEQHFYEVERARREHGNGERLTNDLFVRAAKQ